MILIDLAVIVSAGENSLFSYSSITDDHATMATAGYFNDAVDALDVGSHIMAVTSAGLSEFLVIDKADGVVDVSGIEVPLTVINEIGDNDPRQFITDVSHANKIDRDEIELAITDIGLSLPHRSLSIFVNDFNAPNKVYLCRYDSIQDEWYQELLKKAE